MAITREVAANVFLIDDELYGVPGHGAVYLLTEEKRALVDTGPSSSASKVIQGIESLGIPVEEVEYLIISHIHLDHGGGAGTLLKEMPRAKILVHPRAVKHLIDPSKLALSALEALGKETFSKAGEVLPVESRRIVAVNDNDTLRLSGGQTLTFLHCPGHAPHEICIFESRNRGLFVGDAVGHIVEGTQIMIPVTPPPSFDLELYLQTLSRLAKLGASRIYFPHSGTSRQVQQKLKAAEIELLARNKIITDAALHDELGIAAKLVTEHICDGLIDIKKTMGDVYRYWANNDIPTSADEHVRYYRNKHGLYKR